MPPQQLIVPFLDALGMPAEISAGILVLLERGQMNLLLSVLTVTFAMICISMKKSFFQQAGISLIREPVTVIASGIIVYSLFISLILIFFVSVVGFPIAFFLFFVLVVFIFAGQAALGVMFRELFADKFNRVMGIYETAFVGVLVIEGIKYIPYARWPFQFIVLPIFSIGVLAVAFSNGYVKKIFYPVHMESSALHSNRANIRGIILKSRR